MDETKGAPGGFATQRETVDDPEVKLLKGFEVAATVSSTAVAALLVNGQFVDSENETADAVGGGRLVVIQKKQSYRFSLDAILLASFADVQGRSRVLDIGAGSGVVLICLLSRNEALLGVGVEIQPRLAEMASRSLAINGMRRRAEIIAEDINDFAANRHYQGYFDLVCFNPPYRLLGSGRLNANEEKAVARHELKGSLSTFLLASGRLASPHASIYFVYPAGRLMDALNSVGKAKMSLKTLCFVHPKQGAPAKLVLVRVGKTPCKGAKMLPPVYVYKGAGREYTPQAQRLLRSFCLFPEDFSE